MSTAPSVIVSSDTHIGPLLKGQLREHCPPAYLEQFDEYASQVVSLRAMLEQMDVDLGQLGRNLQSDGHHDPHARLRDLDRDGVAAEVIFHGSQNGEPIPFTSQGAFLGDEKGSDLELLAVGYHIYNRWLADFCSVEPERHVGLAQLPMWDIDAAIRELTWAGDAGLRGVNFPAPKPYLLTYNRPEWEPFWAACEDLGMTLCNHGGAGSPQGLDGPGGYEIMISELSALSRVSPMNQLIYGGVFERHPRLRLVLTELPGAWWTATINELDSIHLLQDKTGLTANRIPRLPSEYARENVFVGASFQAHYESVAAVEQGYTSNVLWGSDYPHVEGTWQLPQDGEEIPMTHLALRTAFAGLPTDDVRAMVGLNAVDALGLDGPALTAVAERIGAPSADALVEPVAGTPEGGGHLAFRTFGPWA
jgi:predicted TIM-barrel fold metal-dependent hydrolase